MSKPSPPSDETGTSSVVEVGVGGTRPAPPLWRERGIGVASEEANRDRCAGGVAVEERRRRLPTGEENVLPIGLERESSGDEGPLLKLGGEESEAMVLLRGRKSERRNRLSESYKCVEIELDLETSTENREVR